jgi:hypothetical protein
MGREASAKVKNSGDIPPDLMQNKFRLKVSVNMVILQEQMD